ncbi:conserved hypothetical protein [Candidatus Terasakiella magnetica]|nr:conserved hypothetical protein [Candidatus Terasakiella magnetica]
MTDPRERILARLKAAPKRPIPECPAWSAPTYGADERKAKFRAMLEASHADVHEVTAADWPDRLKAILAAKGVRSMLYAPDSAAGRQLAAGWTGDFALVPYDHPVEDMKEILVTGVDAALTTAEAAIAQTGSLVLWPSADEPRLMSLLPPIHVALVAEETLADSLAEILTAQNWAASMPTNAVLISGPSKTADIEQTLAYGVHGPKELIVLLLNAGDGR